MFDIGSEEIEYKFYEDSILFSINTISIKSQKAFKIKDILIDYSLYISSNHTEVNKASQCGLGLPY